MKFDQASNAIVAVTGFYADALATMEVVATTQSQQLQQQGVQLQKVQTELRHAQETLGRVKSALKNASGTELLAAIMMAIDGYDKRIPVVD